MALSEDASISRVDVWRFQGQEIKPQAELLAVEALLSLSVNGFQAYQLLYLPGQEIELSLGFLLTSGVIEATSEVLEMRLIPPDGSIDRMFSQVQVHLAKIFHNRRDFMATIAEAVLAESEPARERLVAEQFQKFPEHPVQVQAADILNLVAGLPARQETFRQTGATHAIFLAGGQGKVVLGAEDVGRHNAFDKVIGTALMKNLPLNDKIALLSGRASFEMVLKAARAGISIIASVSAPTSLAVRLAELQGITLMGFVRGGRLNIYSHPERLIDHGNLSSPGFCESLKNCHTEEV